VVVDDVHISGVAVHPHEAEPPMLVDTDTVLRAPVTAKAFQSIRGWHAKVRQRPGVVEHGERASAGALDGSGRFDLWPRQSFSAPALRKPVSTSKSQGHAFYMA